MAQNGWTKLDKDSLVFIDVDTQRDFCERDGSLYVQGAPVERFRQLTKLAVSQGIPIVGSVDAHDFDDDEFESFPAHCVRGTEGQLKVKGTLPEKSRFLTGSGGCLSVAAELRYGDCQGAYFEKQTFSLFSNRQASDVLRHLHRNTAVVYGVATDYCVKAAVLGLCERGFDVYVVTDAIAGVTPETDAEARAEMTAAGALFIHWTDLYKAIMRKASTDTESDQGS
jgi:nicotinamidase/pyrazinamidase